MRLRPPHIRAALRPPGRTVRSRLTWVYGGLFLVSGAVLLSVTALLWGNATSGTIIPNSKVPVRILSIAGLVGKGTNVSVRAAAGGRGGLTVISGGSRSGVSGSSDGEGSGPTEETTGSASASTASPSGGSTAPVIRGQANWSKVPAKQQMVVGQLQALTDQQHSSDLHDLLLYSALALALMAILSIVLGWLTAGRVLRPLRTITSAARDISAHNLHERLELDGPDDELKELGDTFDQLLGRLDRSFQSQRQFVANASHELRTPLATMRATLDVALAKPDPAPPQTVLLADRLRQELDQVDKLLDGFLALARAQAGPTEGDLPLSLDLLVTSALEDQAGALSAQGLTVEEDGCTDARVAGNEPLLARMAENLVDNAVRHNQPGGWVRVRTGVDGGVARLVVENGGPVLDQTEVAALVQPFRRLGVERTGSGTGSGLGLSIVSAIAEAHGGGLALHALDGGGFQAVVDLPLAHDELVGAGTAAGGGPSGTAAGGGPSGTAAGAGAPA